MTVEVAMKRHKTILYVVLGFKQQIEIDFFPPKNGTKLNLEAPFDQFCSCCSYDLSHQGLGNHQTEAAVLKNVL